MWLVENKINRKINRNRIPNKFPLSGKFLFARLSGDRARTFLACEAGLLCDTWATDHAKQSYRHSKEEEKCRTAGGA